MVKVIEYIGYKREGVEGLMGRGLVSRDMGWSRSGEGLDKVFTKLPQGNLLLCKVNEKLKM